MRFEQNERIKAILVLLILMAVGFFVPSSIHPAIVIVKIVLFAVAVWRLIQIDAAPRQTPRIQNESLGIHAGPETCFEPPTTGDETQTGGEFGDFARIYVSVFRNLFAATSTGLYVRNPSGDIILHVGEDDHGRVESISVEDAGPVGRTAKLKKPLIERELPAGSILPGMGSPMVSFAGVPLLVRDQVIGVLALASSESGAFAPEDQPVLESAGAILCRSMTLFHQSIRLEATQALFRVYLGLVSRIKKAQSETETADLLRESLAQVFSLDGMTISRREGTEGLVDYVWGAEDIRQGMRFSLEDGLSGWIIKHNAGLVIKDMAEGIRRPRYSHQENPRHGFRSFLGVPLGDGKPSSGCLCLESRSPAAYDDKSKEILWPMIDFWETISAGIRLKQSTSESKS